MFAQKIRENLKLRCDVLSEMNRQTQFIMDTRNSVCTTTTVLQPFFQDHPGDLVLEENFWTYGATED